MKTITVMIPTYNEEDNISDIIKRVTDIFIKKLNNYSLEILFVDDGSTDNTVSLIEQFCEQNKKIKAIINSSNVGYARNLFHGLTHAEGDCVVLLHADMQNPPELIPDFVAEWERGYTVVVGVKNKSKESSLKYFFRSCYYKLMKHIAELEHIEHFTEFELLDRSFLDVLKQIDDPVPYLRGIIMEYASNIKTIYFTQDKRNKGKTHFNFQKNYDFAMLGISSYSKILIRLATFIGAFLLLLSFFFAIAVLIYDIANVETFTFGIKELSVIISFFGSTQIFFIGLLGEYILFINKRQMKRPLAIIDRRINFEENEKIIQNHK